ncbi:MAG: hypothetical protein KGJ62_10425 [Armatimonadetes bacterium]|nr:hypothetical protein [Armatimonadota bacterium]MDE2207161.1 hypothetical protein [Armatimonadota bacterium]
MAPRIRPSSRQGRPRAMRAMALLCVGLALLVLLGARIYNAAMVARTNEAVASSMQAAGIMRKPDYLRWLAINDQVDTTHTITDSDLAFLLGLINRPLQSGENALITVDAIAPLMSLTHGTGRALLRPLCRFYRATTQQTAGTESSSRPRPVSVNISRHVAQSPLLYSC